MDIRGFHWSSRAWYASACSIKLPSVTFGIYAFTEDGDDDGCLAEMTMDWEQLNRLVARLNCYDSCFSTLLSFSDVLAKLAVLDGTDFSDEAFVQILLNCGFKDLTKYNRDDA